MERKHIVVDEHGSVTALDSIALFGDTHEKNNSLSVVVVVGGIVGLSPFFVMVHLTFWGGRGY